MANGTGALVDDPRRPVRIGMYGVAHSHAAGKARAIGASNDAELAGVYEPDPGRRARAQDNPAFAGVRWFASAQELLGDPGVVAVCVEGPEGRCAPTAKECVDAGKHVWYDKPAGDLAIFRSIVETARERRLHVQMGYMLRYNAAFRQIFDSAAAGLLGDIFSIRGHMSTYAPDATRGNTGYTGGVAFQLASHMIDPAVWLLGGRPHTVTSFLRNDATPAAPHYADNTLVVLEFERGMAMIDVAQMEAPPAARRFEVYGTRGSAIVVEPFEPGSAIRLCLLEAAGGYARGEQIVPVTPTPRDAAYRHELAAFVGTLRGTQPPDRSLDHEFLVEETLDRAVAPARRDPR